MPAFRSTRVVRHTPENMFDLVADVEAYPQFLPLCQALRVRKRMAQDDGREIIVAEMTAGYKAIRETFTSRVTLDRTALAITVEYIDGPFSHLENKWNFIPAGQGGTPGCKVDFFIDYAFRSRTLALLVGSLFDTAFRKFSEAFERRADAIYGRAGRAASA